MDAEKVHQSFKQMKLTETAATFKEIFCTNRFEPVRARMVQFLDVVDLLHFASTCRDVRYLIYDNEWNINKKLRRFVNDPVALRSKLAQTNALISGSFALQFLDRQLWKDSDLDIFADKNSHKLLCDYIINEEGYTQEEDRDTLGYCDTYLSVISTFSRGQRKIQIMQTEESAFPIYCIVKSFYSTAVVNIISWNRAISVYPRSTLINRDSCPLTDLNDYYGQLHAKYSLRGWTMKIPGPFIHEPKELTHTRRVGDQLSWKMKLDTVGVVRSDATHPDYVLDYSCFQLDSAWDEEFNENGDMLFTDWSDIAKIAAYQVFCTPWNSPGLRYQYTYATPQWYEIGRIMDRSIFAQMFKIDWAERMKISNDEPAGALRTKNLQFEKPVGWDYLDEQYMRLVDKLLCTWERTQGGYELR